MIKEGIYLAISAAFISGCSNFIMKFAVTDLQDPYLFTTLKNVAVALILGAVILSPRVLQKMKRISSGDRIKLAAIGVIGGSLPFLLYFKGLSMTSAVNASFIHKTLFIWVAILAGPFLKEKISWTQAGAFFILIVSSMMLSGPSAFHFGWAEGLCLLATILWAVENIISKKVLANVDAKVVAFCRMFFGSLILLAFVCLKGGYGSIAGLNAVNWAWIALSAFLLLGYVLAWYSALKRVSAVLASSILVLALPITAILSSIFIEHRISPKEVFVSLAMALAITIIYIFKPAREEVLNLDNAGKRI